MNGDLVGLSGVAGVLPPQEIALEKLAADGLVSSSLQTLSEFGFRSAYVADDAHPAHWIALNAAQSALQDAGLPPKEIDLLIWASARPENHLRAAAGSPSGATHVMDGFRYAAGWLQDELDLHNAEVLAVTQQGCSTMFSALRLARSLLLAEPGRRHALCVGVDVLPHGAPREILYNVISDAGCAVVVSRDCTKDRWIGYRQISRGYCWDPVERQAEIIAAYFPTSKIVIEQLLAENHLRPEEIDFVLPTGINRSSWEILLRLVGIPLDRLYRGVESFGHSITSDNFIYLQQLRRSGVLRDGSKLLLFTYGFGSSWCGLLLEH